MTLRALERTSSPADFTVRRPSRALLRFAAISGFAWVLDFGLLYILVRWAHLPVFGSNLISASTAALVAFLISHKVAFAGRADSLALRVLFYFAYTLGIIFLASAAISSLSGAAQAASNDHHLQLTTGTCAVIAKLVVTPANFLANFLVARFTSEYAAKSS